MANAVLYGLWNQKDLDPLSPAAELDRDMVIAAVEETVASHNAEIDTLLNLFCEETTDYQRKYRGGYNNFLQPLDENGRPLPVKGKVDYTVGFPLKMGGTASGSNFVTNAKMTVADFDQQIGTMLIGDVNWMRRHLLAALLTNVSYTFTDPIQGALTVQSGANSDATLYAFNNSDALAADSHYNRQEAEIATATNPLAVWQSELEEHPENAGPFIAFAAPDQAAAIAALAGFVEDPATQIATEAPQTTADRLNTTLGVTLPRTAKVLGVYGNLWIVQWAAVPADYTIVIAANGPRPLMRRQDPETGLQGFINVGERMERFPFFRNEWIRRTGFGAWNRTAWYVQQATTGSTTFAIPSGYDARLLG